MLSDAVKRNEELQGILKDLEEQLGFWQEQYEKLKTEKDREIARLERMLKDALHRIYGRRSEKIDPNQLLLPFTEYIDEACEELQAEQASDTAGEEDEEEEEIPRRPRRHRGRKPIPSGIPRKREVLDVDPKDRICPCCQKEMQRIGEDTTEELDYHPASFFVRELVRPKYACGCCQEGVLTAPLPPRPIEKGRPGPGLLSHVVTSKFGDHLPLYRLEQIFDRHGLDLPRSTLADWCGGTAEVFRPVYAALKMDIFSGQVVQGDETPVQVQIHEEPRRLIQGYFWGYSEVWGQVVFDFSLSRESDSPLQFVEKSFRGYLQTDGYAGYDELYKRDGIVRLGCMAHCRRKFYAAKQNDTRALIVLGFIQKLYRIERQAREEALSLTQRLELRQAEAVPTLDKLHDLLESLNPKNSDVLPQSDLGEAVGYALNQWEFLRRYAEVPGAEIDNNSIENAIRHLALGRKNWLQIGSPAAGGRAAILLSLVVSSKRLKMDPFVYLKDVIERVPVHPPERMGELVPRRWKEQFVGDASQVDPPGPSP